MSKSISSSARVAPREDLGLTLDVEPRKPRLAWQGMDRKEIAATVPTQVVEIVRPGRAIERAGELSMGSRAVIDLVRAENRLIWTNDNLVALRTLLDERDPATNDWRYRGKVDLVYIDPPFMVNSDFVTDNAVEIELDEEEGVGARKEPSLVELLAYKDTWRQGLDSFLSMLRARLLLLKDLLAASGSIFVHLDWHAVHYVKVLMDEIFGYENFRNGIVAKRRITKNLQEQFEELHALPQGHDEILWYSVSPTTRFANAPRTLLANVNPDGYWHHFWSNADRPTMRYELLGITPRSGQWKWSTERAHVAVENYRRFEKEARGRTLAQYWRDTGQRLEFIRLSRTNKVENWFPPSESRLADTIWTDVHAYENEKDYPTQKHRELLDRIVSMASPPGGLVLDCFLGSGTTCEAAEAHKRTWIGIDNSKYGIHVARKRLIRLHDQPRAAASVYEYDECSKCHHIERKERSQKSPGPYQVRPFTVENMGVYQRAAEWQGFQKQRTAYRDEMIRVFGGEPVDHSLLLHGRKGSSWVHVGPLDAPVSSIQVWSIAREAQRTTTKAVTVLSADFDTLSASEKEDVKKKTGVAVTIRVIPASAIDEVKRRLELRTNDGTVAESTAVPAFYAPLSILLEREAHGRNVELRLKRCEVDIESFLASQRPLLSPLTEKMTDKQRGKAEEALKRWTKREKELRDWLNKAKSWQAFVDFWAVDWNYGRQVGEDGKPIFVTEWQSFRTRGVSGNADLTFVAKFAYAEPGRYRIAARVTDVFGNDGIASVEVEVKR